MSRLNEFARADWASTNEDTYFNDNAVMTLFKLFAGNENLVDSLVFDYLSRQTPDTESFQRCFTPSRLERVPWLPRRNSNPKHLDQEWLLFPINIIVSGNKHWVCVLRAAVFTTSYTQKITLYYVDSLESEMYEDNVKALLAGTPFYPDCSDKIESEWIRLHVQEQIDGSECGARAGLHGFILSSVIGEKGIACNMSLHGDFLQQLYLEASAHAMLHARTWARQCLALRMPVNLTDIKTKFLGLGWKDVTNERRRVRNRLRKRKERNCPIQQSSRRSISPSLVTEGRNNPTRIDPFLFSSKERDEKCPSQVIESLRARNREYKKKERLKVKEANLSPPDELNKKKRASTASVDVLEVAKENTRLRQRRFRQKRQRSSPIEAPPPSIESCLAQISNGDQLTIPIDKHPEMRKLQLKFLDQCEKKRMESCQSCKKRWWDLKVDGSGICRICKKQQGDLKIGIALMSEFNRMDPFPNGYLSHLPVLNSIEEAMISRVQVIMKCYRLVDGTFGYRGHVMNFENDTSKIFDQLPIGFNELPIVILRKRDDKHPMKYRDFRVRRRNVQVWLEFLIRNNPGYAGVSINSEQLLSLPENGCVSERILTQIEEEQVKDDDAPVASGEATTSAEQNLNKESSDSDEELESEGRKMGPEQGGAAGDEGHANEQGVVEHFLFTPPNKPPGKAQLAPEDEQIKEILENVLAANQPGNNVINMPGPGDPLSDYNDPFIQSKAFPTLFPFGFGDVTGKNRAHTISMTDANKHLVKYCLFVDNRYRYPFAEHPTWMHWAQNTAERHRHNTQKNIYLHKNPEDDNLTEEALEAMLGQRGHEIKSLLGRMQKFNANLPGCNAFFNKKMRELNALIGQEGICTFWWTMSAADNHWVDLFRLILGDTECLVYQGKDELQKAALRRKLRRQNPHIVDAYFNERVQDLVDSFFGTKSPLKATWTWFRIEYQGRGSAHAHGCCRLDCDPGIAELAQKVLKGRQALHMIKIRDPITWKEKYPSFEDEPYHEDRIDDCWLTQNELEDSDKELNMNSASANPEKLEQEVCEGNKAHKVIVQFHDWFLSTIHPAPLPSDAKCDKRDERPAFEHNENNVHPSAIDPATYLRSDDEILRTSQYCQQIDVTERHKCNAYCLRKKDVRKGLDQNNSYCRFGFPYSICVSTHVRIVQYVVGSKNGKKKIKGKGGGNQGTFVVKFRIEIVRKVNDRFLNSHSRSLIEVWQANIDFQLILDSGKVVEYMTKYVCKAEISSIQIIIYMMGKILKSASEEGNPVSSVLKKTMNKLNGERTISQQEIMHLLLSLGLVSCTHNFVNLHLDSCSQELDLEMLWQSTGGQRTIKTALKISLMDAYGRRLNATFWKDQKCFSINEESLRDMPLSVFVARFNVGKRGQFSNKIFKRAKENVVVIFYPHHSSDRNASTYHLYCKNCLLKFKPWSLDDNSMFPFNGIDDPTDEDFISLWEEFLLACQEEGKWMPDMLQRDIDDYIINSENAPREKADPIMAIDDAHIDLNISTNEEEDAAFLEIETDVPHSRNENGEDPHEVTIKWNQNHDWSLLFHSYDMPLKDYVEKYEEFMENDRHGERRDSVTPNVPRSSLNDDQCFAHDVFVAAVCQPRGSSSTDDEQSNGIGRLQILAGQGGCGKTHVINAINTTLKAKGFVGRNFATTGIAAVGIGGSTLHSYARGLGLPINVKGSYKPLQGKTLRRLQKEHKDVSYIIIDEYSMLKQREKYYLHMRCCEIKGNFDDVFGGLAVLDVGDIGQLPPVQGTTLWDTKKNNHVDDRRGYFLYLQFKVVTRLTKNERLNASATDVREYAAILKRLHDGKNTKADAQTINRKCNRHLMKPGEWREKGFESNTATHLFTTNREVANHNKRMIMKLQSAIAFVRAEYEGDGNNAKPKDTMNLDNSMYIAVGASVIITNNLCNSVVNGSRGIIKDIVYEEGKKPPELPTIVWTEIDTYNGPSFFPNNAHREKWFPIRPISHKWWTENRNKKRGQVGSRVDKTDWVENSRKMIPMRLSWALTIWKAQGQTITSKIVLNLGKDEQEHGLTYTGFSRATRFSDVGIFDGFEESRFTKKIARHGKMKPRLLEERRYDTLIEKTKEDFEKHNLRWFPTCPDRRT